MSRQLAAGSILSYVAGSSLQMPVWRFEVWNPNQATMNEIVAGTARVAPFDLTHFIQSASLSDNVGFENMNDPSVPSVSITFKPSASMGIKLRRGLIDDGVPLRIWRYDARVNAGDAVCIFTGRFRGTPGVDAGTRADRSVGLTAAAYGREEQFLNLSVTTSAKPAGTDLGEIFFQIATEHMGLTQDEILVGALGVITRHETNQIKELPALQALWECTFPAGKKPKFNGLGQLTAVDFHLDKPATRIYSAGNHSIRSLRAAPNDIEVNNSVLMVGLDHNLSKVTQEMQKLREILVTVGFFEDKFKERFEFSEDGTLRADETRLRTRTRVKFSQASYSQNDEFSGTVTIDTHYLAAVREIIFAAYLAIQLAIAAIDYFFQAGSGATGLIVSVVTFGLAEASLATERLALQIASQVTLAFLLWAMQFIGRGRYQIWGKPFEYCYQELKSRCQIDGLLPEEVREVEIRNDFISTMEALDETARERLRRELVKNQVVDIEMMDDPALEVDDVVETWEGSRFYILSLQREISLASGGLMRARAWKVYSDFLGRNGSAR